MKYIITGGAGFIGSHVVRHYLSQRKQVLVIDNLSTGMIDNITEFFDDKNFTIIEDDIISVVNLSDVVSYGDVIIHLAATVGVKNVFGKAYETLNNNFLPTKTLLDIARQKNCRMFFASTAEIYGDNDNCKEDDMMMVPGTHCGRTSYIIGKIISECYCLNYFREYNTKVVIGRLFNITGINQVSCHGMVVPSFIEHALKNEPLQVYGDGKQNRSFCNVIEAVDAISLLVENDAAMGQIFNIGNPQNVSIAELAEAVKIISGSESEIISEEYPEERIGKRDIHTRNPCIDKIKQLTGWSPEIDLHQTLSEITTWYKNKINERTDHMESCRSQSIRA